jgi:sulfate adenylyltransferase
MSWTEKEIIIDNRTLCDLECLLDGSFYPLKTFMGKDDWESVINKMELKDKSFFPLPVNLAINKDNFKEKKLDKGVEITLSNEMHLPIAKMVIEEYYEPDINVECELAYGTKDELHPYVKYKMAHKNCYYVSGKLKIINEIPHYSYKELRKTPDELKNYFRDNKWDTIIGFQTRNPMHKSHYYLTKYALNKIKEETPKLLIHPIVGMTQEGDISYKTRVECYKEILKHYPEDTVKLSLLQLSMRMAGPREACFHALIRKNYGCTHFIVGRDHAGPSVKNKEGKNFYGEYDAQELLKQKAKKINIEPIYSKNIIYNNKDNKYYEESKFPDDGVKNLLSGTELRRMIKENIDVPEWFSFKEVINILKKGDKRRGICFYFIGIPCSGKSTHAYQLKELIEEYFPEREVTILDGDEVRNNLSKGLGFTEEDRSINVRRIGWVASEIVKHNGIVICSNIAPYEDDRNYNRELIEKTAGKYIEIFVDTELKICEKRDIKGLYTRARAGEIKNFTGVNAKFEVPKNCEIIIKDNNIDMTELLKLI